MSIDVFPGGGRDDRDLVRRDANNITRIMLMKMEEPSRKCSVAESDCYRYLGCCSPFWTREVGEGV